MVDSVKSFFLIGMVQSKIIHVVAQTYEKLKVLHEKV